MQCFNFDIFENGQKWLIFLPCALKPIFKDKNRDILMYLARSFQINECDVEILETIWIVGLFIFDHDKSINKLFKTIKIINLIHFFQLSIKFTTSKRCWSTRTSTARSERYYKWIFIIFNSSHYTFKLHSIPLHNIYS